MQNKKVYEETVQQDLPKIFSLFSDEISGGVNFET
jgi:hypothetical protein